MKYQKFPIALQRQLEDNITSGFFSTDQIVRVENLCSKFEASVEDIQLVIPSLERKGLVKKNTDGSIQILGVYKAAIESVFQYAEKSKLKPRTIVRSVTIVPAEDLIAKKLGMSPGDSLYVQVRTRMVDDQILANQYNFIPYEVCPGLEEVDLSRASFQVTLEKIFHTVIARIEETYNLNNPERDDREILSITQDQPVLVIQRTSFSRNEFPLVFADIHVNPALFHYVKDLWPKALPLVGSINKSN